MINKINTYRKLGIVNLADVFLYRRKKKSGNYQKQMPVSPFGLESLFRGDCVETAYGNRALSLQQADVLLEGEFTFFSHQSVKLPVPPKWRCTPEGVEVSRASTHWSIIPDFNPAIGDIKQVWELSRFDWLLSLVKAFCHSRDDRYLSALNDWLIDWCRENPTNGGPNWKCGQEAALRMMQVLLAAFLLNEHKEPQQTLVDFILSHCRRIKPTLRYAMAQDNNHGTSEAAALFIAGSWLNQLPSHRVDEQLRREARRYTEVGRKWLENRAEKLIETDGSFSQHSVNYHRVMLDTFSMAEFWRQRLNAPSFSETFYQKAQAATNWLWIMTHPNTGDAPNLGANDGARLFVLSDTDYRDFRPSVQLASALFSNAPVYGEGAWNEPLQWLGLTIPSGQPSTRSSQLFDKGGYCFLNDERSRLQLYTRFPRFRFRPSHADALHLDLWWQGKNILRDGGTFSYNTDEKWLNYFPGTESHNTVQFDDRDQMPRLSRFLFGKWLKSDFVGSITNKDNGQSWHAQYTDAYAATHKREVMLEANKVIVTDHVSGFSDKAILRWRLCPGHWILEDNRAHSAGIDIKVSINDEPALLRLADGYESRYYSKKTTLPVLEAQINTAAIIRTTFLFNPVKIAQAAAV